jgi:hypothetical protein
METTTMTRRTMTVNLLGIALFAVLLLGIGSYAVISFYNYGVAAKAAEVVKDTKDVVKDKGIELNAKLKNLQEAAEKTKVQIAEWIRQNPPDPTVANAGVSGNSPGIVETTGLGQ